MHNRLKRVERLEEANAQGEVIINVYRFNPKQHTVYREYAGEKIYMDWDTVMNDEYTIATTIFAAPNYSNPNWEEEFDGEWNVCVGGVNVLNENNK